MWYPTSLDELIVTETEDGFEFSAPSGTECAEWLGYYNSTEELQEEFSAEIIKAIEVHLNSFEQSGSTEQNTERISSNREQA